LISTPFGSVACTSLLRAAAEQWPHQRDDAEFKTLRKRPSRTLFHSLQKAGVAQW
jgi:hypothetical protein